MSNISSATPPTKSDNHDGINVLIGDDDTNDASSSEYETDSQASEELETDTDDDSETDEGEEEQWSLRVRLLSAVDLPPSLSPTVPLCVSLYVCCVCFWKFCAQDVYSISYVVVLHMHIPNFIKYTHKYQYIIIYTAMV